MSSSSTPSSTSTSASGQQCVGCNIIIAARPTVLAEVATTDGGGYVSVSPTSYIYFSSYWVATSQRASRGLGCQLSTGSTVTLTEASQYPLPANAPSDYATTAASSFIDAVGLPICRGATGTPKLILEQVSDVELGASSTTTTDAAAPSSSLTSSSAAATNAAATATASPESSGTLSAGNKIAVGVAVGLGVPLLLALAFFLLRRRKLHGASHPAGGDGTAAGFAAKPELDSAHRKEVPGAVRGQELDGQPRAELDAGYQPVEMRTDWVREKE